MRDINFLSDEVLLKIFNLFVLQGDVDLRQITNTFFVCQRFFHLLNDKTITNLYQQKKIRSINSQTWQETFSSAWFLKKDESTST